MRGESRKRQTPKALERSKINTDAKMTNEKWQLTNALDGLKGKPFKEESKPEPSKNTNRFTINTETGSTNMLTRP